MPPPITTIQDSPFAAGQCCKGAVGKRAAALEAYSSVSGAWSMSSKNWSSFGVMMICVRRLS